ncbi:MAG: putative glycolipid-binding domain-containing protein [Acidimicrobiia bacterium]
MVDTIQKPMIEVLWHSPQLQSSEHCILTDLPTAHRLNGVVVAPVGGDPADLHYQVEVDRQWRTCRVDIAIARGGRERRLAMVADGTGNWLVDDQAMDDLGGCLDVDLGWTPSTNTLPIRRLGLEVGAAESITAAWVRFPELTVESAEQSYRRLAERRWRYSSGSFVAELHVDSAGIVLRYGPDLWKALAHTA